MQYDLEDEFDEFDENEVDTEPCPYCGEEIYAEADVCPACGSFVALEEVRTQRPNWILWTAWGLLFVIAMFFFWKIF